MTRTADCPRHGRQGIGLVCTHVAHAMDTGADVGSSGATTSTPRGPMPGVVNAKRRLSP